MRNSLSACAFREVLLWIVLQCYWELPLVRSRRGDPLPVGGTGRMRLSTVTMSARSPSRITATESAHTIAKGMGDERGQVRLVLEIPEVDSALDPSSQVSCSARAGAPISMHSRRASSSSRAHV